MTKAISFDFWGTLGRHNPEYSVARTQYLASLFGLSESDADARYKSVKRSYDYTAEKFGGAVTPIQAVRKLLEGQRTTRQTNAVEVMMDLAALARRFPPSLGEGIREAVMEASGMFVLCVTSNTNFISGAVLREVMSGLPISHFSFSDEFGLSKPDSDFFRYTLWGAQKRINSLSARDMVHIGDHEVCDVKGAQRVGMSAILVKNPEHTAEVVRQIVRDPLKAVA